MLAISILDTARPAVRVAQSVGGAVMTKVVKMDTEYLELTEIQQQAVDFYAEQFRINISQSARLNGNCAEFGEKSSKQLVLAIIRWLGNLPPEGARA